VVVADRDGLWGKTARHEIEDATFEVTLFGSDDDKEAAKIEEVREEDEGSLFLDKTGEAVSQLMTIFKSRNRTLIRAILANLQAFSYAAEQDRAASDRISQLEQECRELKKRIADMEEKFESITSGGPQPSGPATGLKQSAAT